MRRPRFVGSVILSSITGSACVSSCGGDATGAGVSDSTTSTGPSTTAGDASIESGSTTAHATATDDTLATGPSESTSADATTSTGDGGTPVDCAFEPEPAQMELHVAVDGDDGNDGSVRAPVASIARAAELAQPGTHVLVHPGEYTTSDAAIASVTQSGTEGAWITFRPARAGTVRIHGNGQQVAAGFLIGGDWIRVQGFELTDFSEVAFGVYSSHVEIIGNHIHDIGRICTDTQYGLDGVYMAASFVTVEGNLIHDIGRLGPGERGCQPATVYYENHDHGVYIEGSTDVRVVNNVFVRIEHGWAVHVYSGSGGLTERVVIGHNTFAWPNPYQAGQIILAYPSLTDAAIVGNVFHASASPAIVWDGSPLTNVTLRDNLGFGTAVAAPELLGAVEASGNLDDVDPLVLDAEGGDFHLMPGSPAIDAVTDEPLTDRDHDGRCRPVGVAADIGAFEAQ